MEMSFADQEDVFEVIEKVIPDMFRKFSNKSVSKSPIQRIPYKTAMLKYGTDKPDLRNPLEIVDVTDLFKDLEFKAFENKIVRIIAVHSVQEKPRSFFEEMTDYAIQELKAKGLAWIRILEDKTFQGPIAKFISEEAKEKMLARTNSKEGDAIFFIAEKEGRVEELAGEIRKKLGEKLELIDKSKFEFCWIVDFPMYEVNDQGNLDFSHNPFSMPQGGLKALKNQEPLEILAYQYDIVCNGVELSSGAVRNHDIDIMIKAFEIAGYSRSDVETKFGALFNAFQYGAPPHAGIAPGLDRMIMLLADVESIREVIAFPMTSKAEDLLMGAPARVTQEQLKELNIKIDKII